MELVHSVSAMQAAADMARCEGRRLVLVPTMGALHNGHLELVRQAGRHGDHVTVSIFVNPTQFAPGEDYETYPRTLDEDLARLREAGNVDCVFLPTVDDMYPHGARTVVNVAGLDAHLCGRFRPGHFAGVTTIVTRLLTACRPHVAVFGLKDAQQFIILDRMVRDLGFGVKVVGVETVREADGLAMSSRNRYLDPEARRQAAVISRAVFAARDMIAQGERDPDVVVEAMLATIAEAPLARVQYAEVIDAETLMPVERLEAGRRALAAAAVYFGEARLIDNQFIPID